MQKEVINIANIINKTMDYEDLKSNDVLVIANELNHLITFMKSKKLDISSWYGGFNLSGEQETFERINRGYNYKGLDGAVDDKNFPWFLYWEIIWVIKNNNFSKGQKILDMGGSSSLFSYYLASKGFDVSTIDIQKGLVENANYVAEQTGWNLKNYVMDMRELTFNDKFDHITSICVYEHIPFHDRININQRISDLLEENGKFSVTFDYKNPSRSMSINSPDDVYVQFVKSSELTIRENKIFFDNKKRYLIHPFYSNKLSWKYKFNRIRAREFSPLDLLLTPRQYYTFGALFLEKTMSI